MAEPTGADLSTGTPQGGAPRSHAIPETGTLAADATRHADPTPTAPPPGEGSPSATATPTPEAPSTDAPASAGQPANAPTGTAGTPYDTEHGQVGSPGDSSTAPSGGDGGARRDDPQWWEWKKRAELRFQDDYAHAVAGGFGATSSGSAGAAQATAPRLTPEVVQHALNARPDALNPYGNRLRNYLEQHFSRIDETGTRRPLDSAEIAAKLEQLRGDGPTRASAHAPEGATPEPSTTSDGATTSDDSRTTSPDPALRQESETSAGQHRPERSHVDPELAPSSNFSPNLTRTGADLPHQVNELVDRARANLLDHYPADAVAGRIRDLYDIARIADRLQVSADAARAGADMRDVVRQVRELSSAVNQYSDRYRDWRDFTPDAQAHRRDGDLAHPGWRDLDGVDPLNSVEMASRSVSIDPTTGRFDPIDHAIAIAKIGDVLGPEFEAHATRLFQRTIPMDMDSVRAALPDSAITPEIVRQVTVRRPFGFHDPELGVTIVDPRSGSHPRSISAVAATVVHEGMHALQPNNALLGQAIDAHVHPDAVAPVQAQLRFEREYQGFAVQQQFLRGLAGFRSADPTADPRIPNSDGYRELAAQTPAQLRELVLRRYIPDAVRARYGLDNILTDFRDLTPENIVNQARSAIIDSIHPINSHRQQGNLYGPITRHVVDTHGLDLDGIRHRQAQLSVPALRDPGSSGGPPSPDQSTGDSSRDGHGHAEAELSAGQGIDGHRDHGLDDTGPAPANNAEVKALVADRVGVHSPELASVVEKLLDDSHPLTVTASLRNPALREQVLSTLEELGRGEAFHAYDGDWQRL